MISSESFHSLRRKDLVRDQGFIASQWESSVSGKTFDVINPATLDKLATLPDMNGKDVDAAVEAAHSSFSTYKQTSARQRARWLRRWSDLCHENIEDLALILTLENGKPLQESRGEVIYGASFLEWFAGEAERTYGEVVPSANQAQRIFTIKQPIGVAALLTPWNFPIAMITRKAGAALAAGCTTVWKPAGETPLSALAQAVLAIEAGFPPDTINVITTLDNITEVGSSICASKLVKKVSFTGSTRVGKLLAKQCSGTLKKLSLELGGNSPFIVFDDANIEKAVQASILAKFRNSGQTCVTANRIFVQESIHDDFISALTDQVKSMKVGDGTDPSVVIGPLTHPNAVVKALGHIQDAQDHGSRITLGGKIFEDPALKGYFIEPTIILDASLDSITMREEVFAPVLSVYKFKTESEVIELANNCDVGLGSFIMTEDIARSWRVAEALETGMVGVNLGMLSACESPFGGVKESGYGREGGSQGIDEYMQVKSVLINVA